MNEFMYNITEFTFVLLNGVVFFVNYLSGNKKFFHPATFYSFTWALIMFFHFLFGFTILPELGQVSTATFVIILAGSIIFSAGTHLVPKTKTASNPASLPKKEAFAYQGHTLPRIIFMLIALIGLPLYIKATFEIFLASQAENFFTGLKSELSYNDQDVGPYKYLITLSIVCMAFNYYNFLKNKSRLNRALFYTTLLMTIVYLFFSTSRAFYLLLFILLVGLNAIYHRINYRRYLIGIVVFIVGFMCIGLLYGKGGDVEDSFKNNLQSSLEYTGVYVVGSVNALDLEVQANKEPNYKGDMTFQFFKKIANSLGMGIPQKTKGLVQEFTFVPYATNVYSIYHPYLIDYGYIIPVFMLLFLGFIHIVVYKKGFIEKDLRYSMYFSFLLYPILMSFFQEQYFSLFSTWLQFAVFIEIFILTDRLTLFLKENKTNESDSSEIISILQTES